MKLVKNIKWLCALGIVSFMCSVNAEKITITVRTAEGMGETVECDNLECVASLKERINVPKNCAVLYMYKDKNENEGEDEGRELSPYVSFEGNGVVDGGIISVVCLRCKPRPIVIGASDSSDSTNDYKRDHLSELTDLRMNKVDFKANITKQLRDSGIGEGMYNLWGNKLRCSNRFDGFPDSIKLKVPPHIMGVSSLANPFLLDIDRMCTVVARDGIISVNNSRLPFLFVQNDESSFNCEEFSCVEEIVAACIQIAKAKYSDTFPSDSPEWEYFSSRMIDLMCHKVIAAMGLPDRVIGSIAENNFPETHTNFVKMISFLNDVMKIGEPGYFKNIMMHGGTYADMCTSNENPDSTEEIRDAFMILFNRTFDILIDQTQNSERYIVNGLRWLKKL